MRVGTLRNCRVLWGDGLSGLGVTLLSATASATEDVSPYYIGVILSMLQLHRRTLKFEGFSVDLHSEDTAKILPQYFHGDGVAQRCGPQQCPDHEHHSEVDDRIPIQHPSNICAVPEHLKKFHQQSFEC